LAAVSFAASFFGAAFSALAVVSFFAVVFLGAAFLVVAFFAVVFLGAAFLAVAFFAVGFLF
jgi:hypothetical protein